MAALRELADRLRAIDGRGYKAYKGITDVWRHADFELHVDHVQGDPFAAPSRLRVLVSPPDAGLPERGFSSRSRALGTAALLADVFAREARRASRRIGTGRGGEIHMEAPGQIVVPQTAVQIGDDGAVEARFTVGLPARGRSVLGGAAAELLTETIPHLVAGTLLRSAHDADRVRLHADAAEDADHLRDWVVRSGLVAFVADESVLPRRSGIDERPLEGRSVVPFRSPPELRVEVDLPNRGRVVGMAIPRGVTLIVGGGFHGKSTLLRALEAGVYNHCPGDGRELAVTVPDAVKVRAEDGRSVAGVDISPFIDGLPFGAPTTSFSTENASGSTSQAAAIVEALEAGAGTLLVDEDTSATNFMIRDRRMQTLVPKEGEPITPFVDQVRGLADIDVSTVLVVGGSGDYLDVADTVVAMRDYRPSDVTGRAHTVAAEVPTGRTPERGRATERPQPRVLEPSSISARKGRRADHVRVPDARTLLFGEERIDLAAVEQIAADGQIRAIGRALILAGSGPDWESMSDFLLRVEGLLAHEGLDALDPRRPGDLVAFRRFELVAALNRLRTLRVRRDA